MEDHALVVGINAYPGMQEDLAGPCNDARDFEQWLITDVNVPIGNIHTILSSQDSVGISVEDAKPYSDQIKSKLNSIAPLGGRMPIGRRLYIFVAGHGLSDTSNPEHTALIAANAEKFGATLPQVVITQYVNYFKRIYAFTEIVLIMDCCRDATVLRNLENHALMTGNVHLESHNVKTFCAMATKWARKSFEKDFNGSVRGIFSYTLMEALRKTPHQNGEVNGSDIKDYVESYIHNNAGGKMAETPHFSGDDYEKLVFRPAGTIQVQLTLRVFVNDASVDDHICLYDGDFKLIKEAALVGGLAEFTIDAGLYKIEVKGTQRSKVIELVEDYEEVL
ncbi:MAG: hypothetical protein ACJAYN_000798 [Bermanella sp.]|jgi:hypothetical protein